MRCPAVIRVEKQQHETWSYCKQVSCFIIRNNDAVLHYPLYMSGFCSPLSWPVLDALQHIFCGQSRRCGAKGKIKMQRAKASGKVLPAVETRTHKKHITSVQDSSSLKNSSTSRTNNLFSTQELFKYHSKYNPQFKCKKNSVIIMEPPNSWHK